MSPHARDGEVASSNLAHTHKFHTREMERLQVRISHTHTQVPGARDGEVAGSNLAHTHKFHTQEMERLPVRISRTRTQIPHARDGEVAGSNISLTHANSTRKRWRGCRFESLSHAQNPHARVGEVRIAHCSSLERKKMPNSIPRYGGKGCATYGRNGVGERKNDPHAYAHIYHVPPSRACFHVWEAPITVLCVLQGEYGGGALGRLRGRHPRAAGEGRRADSGEGSAARHD